MQRGLIVSPTHRKKNHMIATLLFMDELETHLEFERIFADGKKTDYDQGAIYFDFKEVSPVFLGFLGTSTDDNLSSLSDLCRKFFVLGVEFAKTKTI